MRFTRIFAAPDGGSRFEDVDLELKLENVGGGLPPLLVSPSFPASSVTFLEQPEGAPAWAAHVAPRRQLVFLLRGRLIAETTDGERREFGPGDVVLAEDTTGAGHVTIPLTRDVRICVVPLTG